MCNSPTFLKDAFTPFNTVSLTVQFLSFIILSYKPAYTDVQLFCFYLVSAFCVGGWLLFVFCFSLRKGKGTPLACADVLTGHPEVMLSLQPQACTHIIIDSAGSCHRTKGKTFWSSCQLCLNFFFKTEISDRSHHGPLIIQMTCRYDFRTHYREWNCRVCHQSSFRAATSSFECVKRANL